GFAPAAHHRRQPATISRRRGHRGQTLSPDVRSMLLCIDIGNTHVHAGLVPPGGATPARRQCDLPTATALDDDDALTAHLDRLRTGEPEVTAIALCSVVPAATPRILAAAAGLNLPAWQLNHAAALGVPISYPRPAEIGQDRLANAAGAAALGLIPAIVIDLGTAVTFDIISRRGGYEGGIIT